MSLLTLLAVILVAILVFSLLLYIINKYVEDIVVRRILNIAIAVIMVIWLLKVLGVWHALGSVRV